jgi:hypothetical protein
MTADEHRLLEVLAGSVGGSTLLIDFTVDMGGLVRRGFVTAAAERTFAGGKPIKMTRALLTDGGRQALLAEL